VSRARDRELRDPNFVRLWVGETISELGSAIGGPAIRFAAVIVLSATPFEMGLLSATVVFSGLVMSLVAGVLTDRLERLPLMIVCDVGRAIILLSIPLAALGGALSMPQLYVVGLVVPALDVLFRVAYGAYLPSLVGREAIIGANSRLTASAAVAEVGGFAAAGWLVQFLTAPLAVAIDAISFLGSALAIWGISKPELLPRATAPARLLDDIAAGACFITSDRRLLVLAASSATQMFCDGVLSAVYLLFVMNTLGFTTGTLGMIFAVGGISSFFAALKAREVAERLGLTRSMVVTVTLAGAGLALIPMAQGSAAYAIAMLLAHQLITDGAVTIFVVTSRSFVQSMTPNEVIGRVTAGLICANQSAALIGSIVGGAVGAMLGLRAPLIFAAAGTLLAGLTLKAIPPLTESGP